MANKRFNQDSLFFRNHQQTSDPRMNRGNEMDDLNQASSHIGSSPEWFCAWADSSMDNDRMSAVNRQGNESGFNSHTRFETARPACKRSPKAAL